MDNVNTQKFDESRGHQERINDMDWILRWDLKKYRQEFF